MKTLPYGAYMHDGHQLLKIVNRSGDAEKQFANAARCTTDTRETAEAQQMMGVALRMQGELEDSEDTLRGALRTSALLGEEGVYLHVRIKRDLAMTLMEDMAPGDEHKLSQVIDLLSDPVNSFADRSEYWVTVGFIGRAYFIYGLPHTAFMKLRLADHHLRGGNTDYELNNLVWLMRVAGRRRAQYLRRALSLVRRTGQVRRYPEIALIAIGGDRFYRFVRKLREHR